MKILLSHVNGNSFVRATVKGLIAAGALFKFYTGIAVIPNGFIDKFAGISFLSDIRRRRFHPSVKPYLETWPWFELGRLLAIKFGFHSLVNRQSSIFHIDVVLEKHDKHVSKKLGAYSRKGLKAVYAYEDMAIHTFREAKQLGILCFYDLPIGYWRVLQKTLSDQREKWPEWAATMPGLQDPPGKLEKKDEELKLADKIFVASTFTARTLKEYPGTLAPVEIIPYGFPDIPNNEREYIGLQKRPLRLLYVGSLSQRKGIADLFSVAENLLPHIQLTVVGRKTDEKCSALNKALKKHTWIPTIRHQGVLKLMRTHDILVFPSLFEGFGLVITEAMSQGTPVITTERTAGPDIIEHGKDGWLIPAGSDNALMQILDTILLQPAVVAELGKAAMEKARLRPWNKYGFEIAQATKNELNMNLPLKV